MWECLNATWNALPERQQRRFLRHAWPWWSVHRHRIAPEVESTSGTLFCEATIEKLETGEFTQEDEDTLARFALP